MVAAVVFATFGLGLILFRFPPDRYAFYPHCPIYTYLHLQCPGCGSTRALAALLHGHLREALQDNAFTTFLMPMALLLLAWQYLKRERNQAFQLHLPQPAIGTLAVLTAVFTIARNLPH
jgi:hypothetical protein